MVASYSHRIAQSCDRVASKSPAEPATAELKRVISTARWATIASKPWSRQEQIAVLELRALSTSMRWLAKSQRCYDHRVIILSDSSAVVGAVRKGRSSTWSLLKRLRLLAALRFAFGLQPDVRWIPSELNPADHPSRNFRNSS